MMWDWEGDNTHVSGSGLELVGLSHFSELPVPPVLKSGLHWCVPQIHIKAHTQPQEQRSGTHIPTQREPCYPHPKGSLPPGSGQPRKPWGGNNSCSQNRRPSHASRGRGRSPQSSCPLLKEAGPPKVRCAPGQALWTPWPRARCPAPRGLPSQPHPSFALPNQQL